MKYPITLLLILILSWGAYSQNSVSQLDSIYQNAIANKGNKATLDALSNGVRNLYSSHSDTVLFYAHQLALLAEKNNDYENLAHGLINWGICIEFSGNLDSAIVLYKKGLEVSNQHGLDESEIDALNNLGIVYSFKGLYNTSVEYTLQALEIAQKSQDSSQISSIYNNIGLRHSDLKNQKKAIEFFRKALQINLALQKKYNNSYNKIVSNHVNLARSYYFDFQFDSALYYYRKALKLNTKDLRNHGYNAMLCYYGIGFTLLEKEESLKAFPYVDSGQTFAKAIGDQVGVMEGELLKAAIYEHQKDYDNALKYLKEYKTYIEKINYTGQSVNVYHSLGKVYAGKSQYDSAYKYMKRFAYLKDTTFTKQKDLVTEQVNLYKETKAEQEKELLNTEIEANKRKMEYQRNISIGLIVVGLLLIISIFSIFQRFKIERNAKKLLAEKNTIISEEKEKSDKLLLNILPEEVANELKAKGKSKARSFNSVTVLFTDFINFSALAENLSAEKLVAELNYCFKAFDEIISKYNLEKIKTIGDAYMAAGGMTNEKDAAKNTTLAALEMQQFMLERNEEQKLQNFPKLEMRCGLHTGTVVAGIVGVKKFQYDIWGDTVNTASRLESNSEVGKVNISKTTFELIKDEPEFALECRGNIEVKGKGPLEMWFVRKL